jgi:hypothetical protein
LWSCSHRHETSREKCFLLNLQPSCKPNTRIKKNDEFDHGLIHIHSLRLQALYQDKEARTQVSADDRDDSRQVRHLLSAS